METLIIASYRVSRCTTHFKCYIDVHAYEDGHVYACSKVGWLAHPVPGHSKKSGYATARRSIRKTKTLQTIKLRRNLTSYKVSLPEIKTTKIYCMKNFYQWKFPKVQ